MSINELEKELDEAITDFSSEIRFQYHEGSRNVVNETDINELARQTFYALDRFKDSIIKYLKNN